MTAFTPNKGTRTPYHLLQGSAGVLISPWLVCAALHNIPLP